MKKIFFILAALLVLASCVVAQETTSRKLSRETRARYDEAVVRKAVESKRFIVRFERIYSPHGGYVDLRPRSNYIIIDGSKAAISTAYVGNARHALPIAGINMKGRAISYEMVKKMKNGTYEITMRVDNGSSAFDVYLTIGKTGTTNASLNSMHINGARYRGHVVPIGNRAFVPEGSEII